MVEAVHAQWKIAKIAEKQSGMAKISTSYKKSMSLNSFRLTDLRPEVKLMYLLRMRRHYCNVWNRRHWGDSEFTWMLSCPCRCWHDRVDGQNDCESWRCRPFIASGLMPHLISPNSFYRASRCEGGLGSRNSVCPSVRLSHACIVTKLNDALQIFYTTRKGNHSATLTPRVVGRRRPLPSEICVQSDPPPLKNADFDRFPLITSQP